MLSICTQTAISVLHDIALGNALQSVNYLLSAEEWKDLFDKLEKGHLIRCLPDKEPGNLSSYALWHPLSEISLLDVLQALNEPIPVSYTHLRYSPNSLPCKRPKSSLYCRSKVIQLVFWEMASMMQAPCVSQILAYLSIRR